MAREYPVVGRLNQEALISRSDDGDLGCFSLASELGGEMSVETTAPSTVTRPMTGEEYLESIRDRREIYCYGGAR
jgi:hypothetical protein